MSYELIRETTVTARKDHVCIWCGEPIPVGSEYVREASSYCGDFQSMAWHKECLSACRKMIAFSDSWDCEFIPGGHKRGTNDDGGRDNK